MVAGSLGSNSTRATKLPGRLRVMSFTVKAPSAFVETNTFAPTATTRLLLFAGATSTSLAVPGIGALFGQVAPPSVLRQRLSLLLTYTPPAAFGSVATAARYVPPSAAGHGGVMFEYESPSSVEPTIVALNLP